MKDGWKRQVPSLWALVPKGSERAAADRKRDISGVFIRRRMVMVSYDNPCGALRRRRICKYIRNGPLRKKIVLWRTTLAPIPLREGGYEALPTVNYLRSGETLANFNGAFSETAGKGIVSDETPHGLDQASFKALVRF